MYTLFFHKTFKNVESTESSQLKNKEIGRHLENCAGNWDWIKYGGQFKANYYNKTGL